MIGRLQGKILLKQPPLLLLDVHGVGYEVFAPMSTFYQLPNVNESISLHTHLIVREDAQLLYGFYQEIERQLFRTLIKVSGVGPKLALTILSGMSPDEFAHCVQTNNSQALVGIPGIGKKTAERLLVEMRDALAKWHTDSTYTQNLALSSPPQPSQEAIDALTALGYKLQDAKRMIDRINETDLNAEQLIRLALKNSVKA